MLMVTVYQEDSNEEFEFNDMLHAMEFIEMCHECGTRDTSFYVRTKKETEDCLNHGKK